jgi:poly-beta-1,6-N-acetyl-D-glucosamine N-deacetylase
VNNKPRHCGKGLLNLAEVALVTALLLVRSAFGEGASGANTNRESGLIVLCYHDVPLTVEGDSYGVDVQSLVDQLEYLRSHGYTFISPAQVQKAARGRAMLPAKSVLVSFDDGYASFASNVVPVIELYKCPVLLSVCAGWIENGAPTNFPAPLMSWDQIKEAARNPLVTLASHSYDLHKAVMYNPQSNTAHAATSRIYFPETGAYETEMAFRQRIADDHRRAREVFRRRVGQAPDILVWPYGESNEIATEEAKKAGFTMGFLLGNRQSCLTDPLRIDRWVVYGNPAIRDFIENLRVRERYGEFPPDQIRGMQIDLDLVYDPSPAQTERNLGRLIERVVRIKPNTVFLQAFADPDGDGNVDAVYFPNRILPMRADLLNRVCNQLSIRGFTVYVWMPTLAVVLPDTGQTESLRVREQTAAGPRPSRSGYRRLSPFAKGTEDVMTALYADLAAYVRFDGVVFQDDAYLTDFEDVHPEAVAWARHELGFDVGNPQALDPSQKTAWTGLKTKRLTDFTGTLMKAVRRYRPDALSMRTLYASTLDQPQSEEWTAQNYASALAAYDFVAVMAFPEMEQRWWALSWLRRLVEQSASVPGGLNRTVFLLQSYDWRKTRWLSDEEMLRRTRLLVAAGCRHVAYYPDDYTADRPRAEEIKKELSTEVFLFRKPAIPPGSGDRKVSKTVEKK